MKAKLPYLEVKKFFKQRDDFYIYTNEFVTYLGIYNSGEERLGLGMFKSGINRYIKGIRFQIYPKHVYPKRKKPAVELILRWHTK